MPHLRIQKMQAYIRAHYAESVSLDDIAGAANISRSEANRCFHAYVGCSPVDALIQYRLEMARRMLNETDFTVGRISQECGFNSENYFSRRYRLVYGCSPGSLRKMGK